MPNKQISLQELLDLISKRIAQKDQNSYSFKLVKDGVDKVARKIGEEAVEVIIAAFANQNKKSKKTREELIGEICDLFYHSLVLMASQKIELSEILDELSKRNKKAK